MLIVNLEEYKVPRIETEEEGKVLWPQGRKNCFYSSEPLRDSMIRKTVGILTYVLISNMSIHLKYSAFMCLGMGRNKDKVLGAPYFCFYF